MSSKFVRATALLLALVLCLNISIPVRAEGTAYTPAEEENITSADKDEAGRTEEEETQKEAEPEDKETVPLASTVTYSEESEEDTENTQKSLSDCSISLSGTSYTYDGKSHKPDVTVQDGDMVLTKGTDYSVDCPDAVNAGTYEVTITGEGAYTGSVTKEFTIKKADQSLAVKASASSIYYGKTTQLTVSGALSTGKVTYSTSDKTIATVSSAGVVTGKSAGSATITVKAAEDTNYNAATATVKITVKWDGPELTSVKGTSGGVQLDWKAYSGSKAYYRVYRMKSGDTKWTRIATVSSKTLTYTDKAAAAGSTYTYTVRCTDSKGNFTSNYNHTGLTIKYAATPVLTGIAGTGKGIKLTWNTAKGAAKYQVFRKDSGSSWTKIGTATTTSYTDTTVKANKTYTYTVRCITSDGKTYTGGYDKSGLTLKYAATPTLVSAVGDNKGITVTWKKASGAQAYRVYRKTSGGKWQKLAKVSSSTTSYTDTTGKAGKTYIYTVRCVTSDDKKFAGGYDSTGLSIKYAAKPTLVSAVGDNKGITVTWKAATGAVKYRVFRKESGGKWVRLANVAASDSLTYTDTTGTAGKTYIYTVRCISSDEKQYTSGYNSGVTIKYAATPKLTGASNAAKGVKVEWSAAKGAAKYKVFRKTSGGSWKGIGTTTSTSFTDTTPSSGTTYIYTVRCITSDGKTYTGGYDKNGVSVTYIAAPVLVSAKSGSNGVTITWKASNGAVNYKVFRKESGKWVALGTTTSTSYTDTTAGNTVYTYTVRCVSADGKTYTSSYDATGISTNLYTDQCLILAQQFVEAHTTSSQSASAKLSTCFYYLAYNYPYKRYYETPSASSMSSYAVQMFTNKQGNCYRYAAAFACIAKVLGYESRVAVGSISSTSGGMTPHGWTEVKVNGTWYMCDANMQMNHPSINSYMRTSSTYAYRHTCSARYTLTVSGGKAVWS